MKHVLCQSDVSFGVCRTLHRATATPLNSCSAANFHLSLVNIPFTPINPEDVQKTISCQKQFWKQIHIFPQSTLLSAIWFEKDHFQLYWPTQSTPLKPPLWHACWSVTKSFSLVILHNLSGTSFILDDGELDYTESHFIFSNSISTCAACWEMPRTLHLNEQQCKLDIGCFGLQEKSHVTHICSAMPLIYVHLACLWILAAKVKI